MGADFLDGHGRAPVPREFLIERRPPYRLPAWFWASVAVAAYIAMLAVVSTAWYLGDLMQRGAGSG